MIYLNMHGGVFIICHTADQYLMPSPSTHQSHHAHTHRWGSCSLPCGRLHCLCTSEWLSGQVAARSCLVRSPLWHHRHAGAGLPGEAGISYCLYVVCAVLCIPVLHPASLVGSGLGQVTVACCVDWEECGHAIDPFKTEFL